MKIASMLAALAAAAAVAGPVSAGVVLANVDPTVIDASTSTSGCCMATIDFVNHYGFAVDVYWMDYGGSRVFYKTLGGRGSYVQDTYLTHPWLIAAAGSGDTTAHGTGILLTGFASAVTPDPGWSGLSPDIANIGGVPEPATWTMALVGVGAVGGALRMARRKAGVALVA
jgi:hypothetical protein